MTRLVRVSRFAGGGLAGCSERGSSAHMDVQVLGVLISTEMRHDAGSPLAGGHVSGDVLDYSEELQSNVPGGERQQRVHVTLGHDDDGGWPGRSRAVEREHLVILVDHLDRLTSRDRDVAVEIPTVKARHRDTLGTAREQREPESRSDLRHLPARRRRLPRPQPR